MIKLQREPERLNKKLQPDIVERMHLLNKKFKVIFRHAYSLMEQVLLLTADPTMRIKARECLKRLQDLLD